MRRKKRTRYILSMILIGICMITGCKPLSQERGQTGGEWENLTTQLKETAPNEVDSHITVEVSENFIVDADIYIPDELTTYAVGNLKMTKHLFEDKEILLQRVVEECNWESVSEPQLWDTQNPLENGDSEFALGVNGSEDGTEFAQVRDSYITMSKNTHDLLDELRPFPMHDTNPIRNYRAMKQMEEPAELDFLSREEVEAYAKDLARDLGVEIACDSIIYTFTQERLQSYMEQRAQYYEEIGWTEEEPPEDVTKADEVYLMELYQGYNGIPLFPYSMPVTVTNSTSAVSKCTLLYSKDGLWDLSLYQVYDIAGAEEEQKILTPGEILELQYNGHSSMGRLEKVVEVRLYYLPICTEPEEMEYIAKPIWYVLSEMGSGEGVDATLRATVYDAVTGEEMYLE